MLTAGYIEQLSYPDFVGFINQWNVLPGAYDTVNRWAVFGRVTQESSVIQMACTTGFQSRELARLTDCRCLGVDLSPTSIEMAEWNRKHYAPKARLSFVQGDAANFTNGEQFTHVAIGGGLKFFNQPNRALAHFLTLLTDEGYLLASPFFVTSAIPADLMAKAKAVFGIFPTNEGYAEVMRLYRGLDILHEQRFDLNEEPLDEIEQYCDWTVKRACEIREVTDLAVVEAMRRRLLEVRLMSNELRRYQNYSALVLRYSRKQYPHRYVELF